MNSEKKLSKCYADLVFQPTEHTREILELGLYDASPELEAIINEALEYLVD